MMRSIFYLLQSSVASKHFSSSAKHIRKSSFVHVRHLNSRQDAPRRTFFRGAGSICQSVIATSPSRSLHFVNLQAGPGIGDETQAAEDDDTEHHIKRYSLRSVGGGQGRGGRPSAVITTGTGHTLGTDVPKNMGGDDSAPQPVEHLLAAFAGCAQATAIYVGRRMVPRLAVAGLDFELEATRDQRGALVEPIEKVPNIPSRLMKVKGTVTIRLMPDRRSGAIRSPTSEEMAMLAQQTELRCPVANMMLASGCKFDIDWVDRSSVAIDMQDP